MVKNKPPTEKQLIFLSKYKIDTSNLSRKDASAIINRIINEERNAWAYSFPNIDDFDQHSGDFGDR